MNTRGWSDLIRRQRKTDRAVHDLRFTVGVTLLCDKAARMPSVGPARSVYQELQVQVISAFRTPGRHRMCCP